MCHVSFDRVKIKGGQGFAKGLKLGSNSAILKINGQNRKFCKLEGPKVHFSQIYSSTIYFQNRESG